MTDNGPSFAKKLSYTSDVQFGYTLSPEHKSNAILFDNFSVSILPAGPPIAIRSLSIGFPLIGVVYEAELAIDVRGAILLEPGTNGTFVLRVLGETRVLDPLSDPGRDQSGNFLKSLKLKIPAGSEDLRMTLIIAVEQGASKQLGQASLTVDSLDLSIGQ
jgi:hypothetical protein